MFIKFYCRFAQAIKVWQLIITSLLQEFDQKKHFFEGWPWLNFNNLGLALGMALKFYSSEKKSYN